MSAGRGVNIHANNERPLDLATQKLAEELHKQINRKFKKRTVYSGLKDNIGGADLVDMKLLNKSFQNILK